MEYIYIYTYSHVNTHAHHRALGPRARVRSFRQYMHTHMYICIYAIYVYIHFHKQIHTHTTELLVQGLESEVSAMCAHPSAPQVFVTTQGPGNGAGGMVEFLKSQLYTNFTYEVATISRLLKIIGLFCRI